MLPFKTFIRFSSLSFFIIVGVSVKTYAIAPIIAAMAVDKMQQSSEAAEEVQDTLELTSDLFSELGEKSDAMLNFTKKIEIYNRELAELTSDMRAIGYTSDDVSETSKILSSSQESLQMKIRFLTNTIRRLRGLRAVTGLLKKNGDDSSTQKMLLVTEQESLHMQIEKNQSDELRNLEEAHDKMAMKRSMVSEVNQTASRLAKNNLQNLHQNTSEPGFFSSNSFDSVDGGQDGGRGDSSSLPLKNFGLTAVQKYASFGSIFLLVLGFAGLLFNFFQTEGLGAVKAGSFGLLLSYVLPLIVHLYRGWLGV